MAVELDEPIKESVNGLLDALDEYGDDGDEGALKKALAPFDSRTKTFTVTYTVIQKATYTIEVEARDEEDAQQQLESGDIDPTDGDEQETEDIELDEVVDVEEA